MDGARESVLVVDDEASIRETMAALLEDDYETMQAVNSTAALRLLRTRRFDVLCTDFRMPGMNGLDLLREAQKLHGAISGIVVTAYADYPSFQDKLREVPCLVLLKPYEPDQLYDLVARAARLARTKFVALNAAAQSERLVLPRRG